MPDQPRKEFKAKRTYVVQMYEDEAARLEAFCEERELPFFDAIDAATRAADGGDPYGTMHFDTVGQCWTNDPDLPLDEPSEFCFYYECDEIDADHDD